MAGLPADDGLDLRFSPHLVIATTTRALTGPAPIPEHCLLVGADTTADSGAFHATDETETAAGTTITLIDAKRPADWVQKTSPQEVATWLGLAPTAPGLVAWDVFDAVLTPGDIILLASWRDRSAAEAFETAARLPDEARFRRVRVVRDYGMFERHEAPQYYPAVRKSPA